jgi:hypothetical protein
MIASGSSGQSRYSVGDTGSTQLKENLHTGGFITGRTTWTSGAALTTCASSIS